MISLYCGRKTILKVGEQVPVTTCLILAVLNNLYEKNTEAYLSAVKNIDSLTLSATTKEEDWGKLFEDCKNFLNIITIRYDTSGNGKR